MMSNFSDATNFKQAVADEGKGVPDPAHTLTQLCKLLDIVDSILSEDPRKWYLNEIEDKVSAAYNKLREARHLLAPLEDGIAQQTEDIEGLQGQIDDLTGELTEVREELQSYKDTLEETKATLKRQTHGLPTKEDNT